MASIINEPQTHKALEKLVSSGSCHLKGDVLSPLLEGLAHPCANGANWVISQRLLSARQQLNSDNELIAAMLATVPELQIAWCRLMAARCKEAGELLDPLLLIRLVTQLNGAAEWVEQVLEQVSLSRTGFTELERQWLGAPAEQSQATPALTRVLAVASQLQQWQQHPLNSIEAIKANRPDINWRDGRLIQQPGLKAAEFQYMLSGVASYTMPAFESGLSTKAKTTAVMDWLLLHPWAYLLALISYEQNVWQVEVAGGLLLELPPGQSPQQPTEVQVLVANADGDELFCGHLGTFVLKILSQLNMGVFPAGISEAALNSGLARVIGELLSHKVWVYREGLSGQQGYYQIHPDFSDACYGLKGQPSFSRYSRHLRRAIRSQAIQWRNDRRVQATTSKRLEEADAA
ncbi:MAG: hypothetical protein DRR42_01570 [Gammaproteobacteria bacterium]|nr:MAG: hypothetical protein DRR42_01570 [Gammaproteobacteria bacterium]